jgi:peptidyl-prolyl cis-trans isomerase C
VHRVLPFVAILIVVACTQTPPTQASTAKTGDAVPASNAQQAEPVKPVPAQLPEVLARVNGESITKADFEDAVKSVEARAGGPVPADQRDRIFRGILDDLIGFKLLAQEARTRKVAIPDAEVDARINQIRSQFPSEAVFTQMLNERKMTLDQVKADAREDMAIGKMIEGEIATKIAVKPEQVQDFYAKNPDQFQQPERVRASHILIGVPETADAAAKTQARAKAEQILKDVKAGKDFAALAKEHSSDPGSAVNGGDLGYFQQGQMVGPFNDAAFSLKPGATSELVETQFGFHIIRVADKQAPRAVPLEEVRAQVEQYLSNMNRQQETEAFVNALKAKAKLEVLI